MNMTMKSKRIRRIVAVMLMFAMMNSIFMDINFYDGTMEIAKVSEAATGEVNQTQLLTSEVVPDAVLLEYLKDKVQEADSDITDRSGITVQNLALKVTSDLVIPAGVKNLTGLGWARQATSFDISLATQVTEIKDSEFEKCNMREVILPSSITKIGNSAFASCERLQTINLNNVTYIGNSAFASCAVLTDASVATMKETVQYLGSSAFQGCKSITTIAIPRITATDVAQTVPAQLFGNCAALTKVKFCDSNVTKIQDNAFNGTGALSFTTGTEYGNTIPKTVSFLGDGAFSNSKITSLDLSDTAITVISKDAFASASLSESFVLPANTVSIGEEAFSRSGIKAIEMPDTVTTLGKGCFELAASLGDVKLSKNITTIPEEAFMGAGNSGISNGTVVFESEDPAYVLNVSYNNATAADSKLTKIEAKAFNCAAVFDDSFLSGLTKLDEIGAYAFASTNFISLEVPASVSTLGVGVFNACGYLTTVEFADGSKVTELPNYCFGSSKTPARVNGGDYIYSCIRLKSVKLPENLKEIGWYCFGSCYALETTYANELVEGEINFPNTLITILDYAFYKASSFDSSSYSGITSYCSGSINIPDGGIRKVNIPDSVVTVGQGAFQENVMLEEVSIGKGLKNISEEMFYRCGAYASSNRESYNENTGEVAPASFVGLKTIKMSDNIENIGRNAFYQCYALTTSNDWILPENLETIGDYAFYECKSLSSVVFNSALTSIGISAYEGSSQYVSRRINGISAYQEFSGLSKVDFTYATSLKNIGDNAFKITNLSTISFPSKVTVIPRGVCDNCYNLETVTGMSEDVVFIGENAFNNCYKLYSVKIPFSAEWAKTIFSGITANNTGKLSLQPAKNMEQADVIIGRTTNLTLNCFKNFPLANLTLAVTDADKDETDTNNNLIINDTNEFIKVTNADSIISMYGKKMGSTSVKVYGRVRLFDAGLNAEDIVLSISQKYGVNVTAIPVTNIAISSNYMIKEGNDNVIYMSLDSYGTDVTGDYSPGNTTEKITWSNSNDKIISVSSPYEVTGKTTVTIAPKAIGDTILTLSGTQASEKCIVKVRVPVNSISLSNDPNVSYSYGTIATGKTCQLYANVSYEDKYASVSNAYREKYIYSSSDTSVATVSANGLVKGIKAGQASITAYCQASGRTATYYITVEDGYVPPVSSISLATETMEINVGQNKTLTAKVYPIGASTKLTWSSSDTTIVTVNNGVIKALRAGTATITVQSGNGVYKTCEVIVKSPAKKIKIMSTLGDSKKIYVKKGESVSLWIVRENDDCTDTFKFSAKKNKVGKVSTNGIVTAKKKTGKFTVTMKSYNGKKKTGTAKIKVYVVKKEINAKKVKITGKKTVRVGKKIYLKAKTTPKKSTNTITWTSSNPQVATVGGCGIVRAQKKGKVKITATTSSGKSKTIKIKVKK